MDEFFSRMTAELPIPQTEFEAKSLYKFVWDNFNAVGTVEIYEVHFENVEKMCSVKSADYDYVVFFESCGNKTDVSPVCISEREVLNFWT